MSMLGEIGVTGDFLATVSRLEKMKQPEQNLLVLKKLHELGQKINFVFIGDGSMRSSLQDMARELGLANYVFFAGNRQQEWIAKVLPQARLVLSPHMGRALTEACLAGVPIVAYDYDWQGEIIRSDETGELVPNGDWQEMALQSVHLLTNRELANRLGRAARTLAMEMMAPEALVDIEVRAYEKLLRKDA